MHICILHVYGRACSMMCISEGIWWSRFSPSTIWTPGFNSDMIHDTQVSSPSEPHA